MVSGETGERLSKLIKKAIRDLKVTNAEYEEIMAAFPDEPIPADRLEVEKGRRQMKYDIKDKFVTARSG